MSKKAQSITVRMNDNNRLAGILVDGENVPKSHNVSFEIGMEPDCKAVVDCWVTKRALHSLATTILAHLDDHVHRDDGTFVWRPPFTIDGLPFNHITGVVLTLEAGKTAHLQVTALGDIACNVEAPMYAETTQPGDLFKNYVPFLRDTPEECDNGATH